MSNTHNENQQNITDELTEGKLYKLENGELIELQIDPEDLRKVKIMEEAVTSAITLQKAMRPFMNGFKPDLTTVCSALIKNGASRDDAKQVVANYWFETAQKARDAICQE